MSYYLLLLVLQSGLYWETRCFILEFSSIEWHESDILVISFQPQYSLMINRFFPHSHQCSRHQRFQYVCFVNFEQDDLAYTLESPALKNVENCCPCFLLKRERFPQKINELVEVGPKASLGLTSHLKFLPSLLQVQLLLIHPALPQSYRYLHRGFPAL